MKVKSFRSFIYPDRVDQLILVDFSWLLHRSYHGFKNTRAKVNGISVPTGDIFGVIQCIKQMTTCFPCAAIVLCMDDPLAVDKRREIVDTYKRGRDGPKDVYVKVEEILQSLMVFPQVTVAHGPQLEADDIMFSLAKLSEKAYPAINQILLFTIDRDLYQTHSDKIQQFTSIKQGKPTFVGMDDGKFDCPLSGLVLYRSLEGDSSDNLFGYSRMPKALIKKLAAWFSTPEEVLAAPMDRLELTKSQMSWFDKIKKNPGILQSNFKVMKLKVCSGISISRCEGTFEHMEKYQMVSTISTIKSLIHGKARPATSKIGAT